MWTISSPTSMRRSARRMRLDRPGGLTSLVVTHPRLRRAILIALPVAAIVLVLAALMSLPLEGAVTHWATRLEAWGPTGTIAFFALFGALAMVFVPTSVLSLVAGLVYGWSGAVLAWAAMMLVASLSFLLARTLAAERVARLVAHRRRLRVLSEVIDGQGWRIVLLVRVSGMVPFGVQNYAFGVTRIAFAHFLAATSIGVLPSILLSVSAGIAGHQAISGDWDPVRLGAVALSILVSLTLIVLTARDLRARFAARGEGR